MDFDLRKANARTLLPMASLGFACLWAFMLFALLGPMSCQVAGGSSDGVRLAFIAGGFALMLAAYLKKDLITIDEGAAPACIAVVACFPLGLVDVLGSSGVMVPLQACLAAGAASGAGFALAFLEWPKAFMVGWKRDVGVFLALGAAGGAVLFLFCCNLTGPYRGIAALLLPMASMGVHRFVVTHIVMGVRPEKEPAEQTKLFALTGFTVMLFGMVFGAGFFFVAGDASSFAIPVAALALVVGFGSHIVLGVLVKRYIPFGNAEKISLPLCALPLLVAVVVGPEAHFACGICLLAVWAYLDLANLSSLVGFASGHEAPFWRIARGQMVLNAGVGLGWGACAATRALDLGWTDMVPYAALGIVVAIGFIAVLVPFQDNAFADKNSDGAVDAGGAFMQRCARVSSEYKLSGREAEVLRYLAKGRNAQFISEELFISAYTVKTHIYHIYQKLGVNSQQELITIVDAADAEFQ